MSKKHSVGNMLCDVCNGYADGDWSSAMYSKVEDMYAWETYMNLCEFHMNKFHNNLEGIKGSQLQPNKKEDRHKVINMLK